MGNEIGRLPEPKDPAERAEASGRIEMASEQAARRGWGDPMASVAAKVTLYANGGIACDLKTEGGCSVEMVGGLALVAARIAREVLKNLGQPDIGEDTAVKILPALAHKAQEMDRLYDEHRRLPPKEG